MATDTVNAPANTLTERKSLSIFLTGATSPLGQVITRHLVAAGHQVTGTAEDGTRAALIRANGGLPVYADLAHAGELKNAITFRKSEVVINAATQFPNHVPFQTGAWEAAAATLVSGTDTLINAAAAAGAAFYLHTSYAAVYGDQHGKWVDETTRPEPGDHALLKAALMAEKKALNAPIPGCVLRLGYLYGAEIAGLQQLIATLRGGRPVSSSSGYASWVSLGDAAEAVRRAAEARIAGGIYNVVDGTPASGEDFLKHFSSALGMKSVASLPRFLAKILPGVQIGLPGISAQVRNSRAGTDLGWTPHFGSHIAGLEDTLLSWRAAEAAQ